MNPALPLLALLSLGGLLWRRRAAALPIAICGIAAMALLGPALRMPEGIPSPAASLAHDPPWQAVADPARGNPVLSDVTYQIYPLLLYLRQELRSGRLPFWNPYQSAGTPFWGNGQGAPLFPLHLLFAALPLQLGFVLLPWLRIVIGGCGAWALARALGIRSPAASLPALIYPLSGMVTGFLLFPMGNALMLVPWVLWATERLAAGTGGWPALALLAGLQMLGGHPETALHTALLSALYLAVRGCALGAPRTWGRWLVGWTVGAMIAAVHLLPLASTLLASSRWLAPTGDDGGPPLALLLLQPLRVVLPDLYGNPARGTWWGPFNYLATSVYAGAATLSLAAAGAVGARHDRRWRGVLVVLAFSFAAAYHLPVLRQLLLAMPLLGRALQHRLIFGIELALALLAGAGADRWLAGRGRASLAGGVLTLSLLALAWTRFSGDWQGRGLTTTQLRWTLWVAGIVVLLAASLALPASWRATLWPGLALLVAADLVLAHAVNNPAQPLAELYPRTGAVAFLAGRQERVAATGTALRPNAAMVYHLFDVRGDDTIKSARYEQLYASHLGAGHPTYFRPLDRWQDLWLDRLGVRWVLTGPAEEAPVPGWRLAYAGADARVFERPAPWPLARWGGSAQTAGIRLERREPGRWELAWQTTAPATLVVAEAWDRGWQAELDGRRVPVEPVDGELLGVRVGAGAGHLELHEMPAGLGWGALLSVLGLALAAAGIREGWG